MQLLLWIPWGTRPLLSSQCVGRIQLFSFTAWASHWNSSYNAKIWGPWGTIEIHIYGAYLVHCVVQISDSTQKIHYDNSCSQGFIHSIYSHVCVHAYMCTFARVNTSSSLHDNSVNKKLYGFFIWPQYYLRQTPRNSWHVWLSEGCSNRSTRLHLLLLYNTYYAISCPLH